MFGVPVAVTLLAAAGVVVASGSTGRPYATCDVTAPHFGAVGDGVTRDTTAIRTALAQCDVVVLPAGRTFLSGPLNLTSNQVFVVDGTFLASTARSDYPIILPLMGYGWGDDENCFPPGSAPHKASPPAKSS
jgi:polygalacturonase